MKKSTRKWMALLTVVAVLAVAGSALAYGGRHGYGRQAYGGGCGYGGGWGPGGASCPGWQQGYPGQGHPGPGPMGMYRGGPRFEAPQAILDKQVEADKLRIDLQAEMNKPQIDRAKVLEIWKKHHALRGEIAEWFFTQQLEWMGNRPFAPQ